MCCTAGGPGGSAVSGARGARGGEAVGWGLGSGTKRGEISWPRKGGNGSKHPLRTPSWPAFGPSGVSGSKISRVAQEPTTLLGSEGQRVDTPQN